MEIDGIGLYTEYLNQTATSKTSNNISNMSEEQLKNATDEELMAACKQFEAYFIEQIFKQAKSAFIPKEEASDGATQTLLDYYEDSLATEYATAASEQQENGLAQMLFEQMKRNYEL